MGRPTNIWCQTVSSAMGHLGNPIAKFAIPDSVTGDAAAQLVVFVDGAPGPASPLHGRRNSQASRRKSQRLSTNDADQASLRPPATMSVFPKTKSLLMPGDSAPCKPPIIHGILEAATTYQRGAGGPELALWPLQPSRSTNGGARNWLRPPAQRKSARSMQLQAFTVQLPANTSRTRRGDATPTATGQRVRRRGVASGLADGARMTAEARFQTRRV